MSGGPGQAGNVIEVWQAPDRLWRWRYLDPSEDGRALVFLSNKEYQSREAALRSATTAYPEVPVRETTAERPAVTGAAGRWRVHRRDPLLLLGLAALAAALLWSRRARRSRVRRRPRDRVPAVGSRLRRAEDAPREAGGAGHAS
jgi:hypothetical protein